jgi:hypothetical protein
LCESQFSGAFGKACFPLNEFIRANREKKQLDWLATNADATATQSHSCFAYSRENNRQVENGLKPMCLFST